MRTGLGGGPPLARPFRSFRNCSVIHSINVIKTQQAAESLESHFIVSHLQISHGGMQGSVQEAFSQSKLKSVLLTYFSRYLCRISPREKNYVLDIIIEACTPQLPNSAYLWKKPRQRTEKDLEIHQFPKRFSPYGIIFFKGQYIWGEEIIPGIPT